MQDLIETNEYTFRVYAENAAGAGKPCEPLGPIVAKDPFSKPGKPGRPEVSEVAAETATLAWAAPRDDGNSPITNYVVEMRRAGDFTWTVANRSVLFSAGLRKDFCFFLRITRTFLNQIQHQK